ncbi:hypothetical protein AAHA92_26889 [Salvia divinorum]|uniref:Myb-like domain-containing protein n=1 Tax=Salvia divinorum TaxID=28513 RepID=A0ABD1G208_SALDI
MAPGGRNTSNGGTSKKADLRRVAHNPGLSPEWTPHEVSALEDLREKYASEGTPALYVRIAQSLRSKTVRHIASRILSMNKLVNGKRKNEDIGPTRKNKGKKFQEKGSDALPESSQVANGINGLAVMPVDSGDILNAIDDPAGQILRNNARALHQIFNNNFSACKIDENFLLFTEARANINLIFEEFKKPEADINVLLKELRLGDKKTMEPFPDKLNDDAFSLEGFNTAANHIA